jgi:hypothetical protein
MNGQIVRVAVLRGYAMSHNLLCMELVHVVRMFSFAHGGHSFQAFSAE